MARRAQLSTGDNTAKTWNPSAWKRKQPSVTTMAEETETCSHRAQLPSHMVMVRQKHLYRLRPVVVLQSCHGDKRWAGRGGEVQHESVCATPYVPIAAINSEPQCELGGAESSSMRAYVQPPHVPIVVINSAPRVGYCLRKPELRELRMKWWHFKSKPTMYERNHKGGQRVAGGIYSSMPFKQAHLPPDKEREPCSNIKLPLMKILFSFL